MRAIAYAAACIAACPPAFAQAHQVAGDAARATEPAATAFGLGQIIVRANVPTTAPLSGNAIGGQRIGQAAIEAFGRTSLDEAASLIPGVTAGNSGGSRNERLLFVRGFDRFQVPLSIDGIRVYLPADNRLDYGRFLTPDIAEIQVAKGYASVLDGPGAMGGAVNLVTRQPTKPLEAEARIALQTGGDLDYNGATAFALLGTRQEQYYAQASVARNVRDHWDLPGSFVPTVITNEDGGRRDFSRSEDWRVNLKAGFTPNATDEYALSYTRQEGSKNAPLHISDTSNVSLRNWSWPRWDIESLYLLTTTALGDNATLKGRAFTSKYNNLLRSWDNRSQTAQTLPRSFDSPYDDAAYGGSLELAAQLTPDDHLAAAFHYRHDQHSETQTSRPDLPASLPEPRQTSLEHNYSLAAENRLALPAALALTVGASYDWRETARAEEFGVPQGASGPARLFGFPLRDAHAFNAQGRLDWTPDAGSQAHLSLSSRARFPTLFERFSSQFGAAEPNPALKLERASNLEVGGAHSFDRVQLSGAVFYSWLSDALVSVRTPANLNRRENYGSADYYGLELTLDTQLSATLSAGANCSYIHRSFHVGTPPTGALIRPFALTDVPGHKGVAWLSWQPRATVELLPSVEFASDRTTVTPASANGMAPVYYNTGRYVLANLRVNYALTTQLELGLAARNLFDDLHVLSDGFPEPGREFVISLRLRG